MGEYEVIYTHSYGWINMGDIRHKIKNMTCFKLEIQINVKLMFITGFLFRHTVIPFCCFFCKFQKTKTHMNTEKTVTGVRCTTVKGLL